MAGGLSNTVPEGLSEVDVIVAGGGGAGCVVAARLHEALPDVSILVVEGGQDNRNDIFVQHPLLGFTNLLGDSPRMMAYTARDEPGLGNRDFTVVAGGVLGGGTSVNFLTYNRPQRDDLDGWNMPGWTADEMLPYMNKLETYHGAGSPDLHGSSGPLHISRGPFAEVRSADQFIEAAARLGWPETPDLMDLDTNNAVQRNLAYISPDGKRQDTASRYLLPHLEQDPSNLHIVTEHLVSKVIFEGDRAVGVEFHPNPKFQNGTGSYTVRARKTVVVSCGTFGTPLVLQRSGVGDPSVLGSAGVDVVADLPGVGRDYQDHQLLTLPYWTTLLPHETFDAALTGRASVPELIRNNDPILSWNAADVISKVRPSEKDVSSMPPAFRKAWDRDFNKQTNRPVAIITTLNGFAGQFEGDEEVQFMSMSAFTTYPYSRGHVRISGPLVTDAPDFQAGFLSDEGSVDVQALMWAYKKQREIARRMEVYRGEYAPLHPPFPAGSAAEARRRDAPPPPPPSDVADIEYSSEDDAVLEEWVRRSTQPGWHGLGTCKMAPRDQGGVVDASLGVHGIKGLKVVDLSVVPVNVAANTANMVLAIAEKAAVLIKQEISAA